MEPLYSAPVLGFRCFKLSSKHLYPLNGGGYPTTQAPWIPGENLAHCGLDRSHPCPAPSDICECGLHAYHSLSFPVSILENWPGRALAAVAGAGAVEIHKHGWRSQKAQVLALWSEPINHLTVSETAWYYQVPVFDSLATLEAFAKKFAAPAPEELRPQRSDAVEELEGWNPHY